MNVKTSAPEPKWRIGAPTTGGHALPATISAQSKERVRVPVRARNAGAAVDPTGTPPELAFMATTNRPGVGDWEAGTWDTDSGRYMAQCLIGAGALVLAAGRYAVWIRVTLGDEVVVRHAGALVVTP